MRIPFNSGSFYTSTERVVFIAQLTRICTRPPPDLPCLLEMVGAVVPKRLQREMYAERTWERVRAFYMDHFSNGSHLHQQK